MAIGMGVPFVLLGIGIRDVRQQVEGLAASEPAGARGSVALRHDEQREQESDGLDRQGEPERH